MILSAHQSTGHMFLSRLSDTIESHLSMVPKPAIEVAVGKTQEQNNNKNNKQKNKQTQEDISKLHGELDKAADILGQTGRLFEQVSKSRHTTARHNFRVALLQQLRTCASLSAATSVDKKELHHLVAILDELPKTLDGMTASAECEAWLCYGDVPNATYCRACLALNNLFKWIGQMSIAQAETKLRSKTLAGWEEEEGVGERKGEDGE